MCSVEGVGGLQVVGIIGAVACVEPAPLVDAPHLLAKAVHRSVLLHGEDETSIFHGKTGERSLGGGDLLYDCLCGEWVSKSIFADHA